MEKLFFLVFLILGASMAFSAYTGEGPFLNSKEDEWHFNSQAFIKKFFGNTFLRLFTLVMGAIFTGIGFYGLLIMK